MIEDKILLNTFNLDKKSLLFFNSKKDVLDMTTDDFFSIDDIVSTDEDNQIKFTNSTTYDKYDFLIKKHKNHLLQFSDIQHKSSEFDVIVEITYKKKRDYTVVPKDVESVRLITYDVIDYSEEKSLEDFGAEKKITNFQTLIIKPKKILVTEMAQSKGLINIIKEFKRDNKLDELGI